MKWLLACCKKFLGACAVQFGTALHAKWLCTCVPSHMFSDTQKETGQHWLATPDTHMSDISVMGLYTLGIVGLLLAFWDSGCSIILKSMGRLHGQTATFTLTFRMWSSVAMASMRTSVSPLMNPEHVGRDCNWLFIGTTQNFLHPKQQVQCCPPYLMLCNPLLPSTFPLPLCPALPFAIQGVEESSRNKQIGGRRWAIPTNLLPEATASSVGLINGSAGAL